MTQFADGGIGQLGNMSLQPLQGAATSAHVHTGSTRMRYMTTCASIEALSNTGTVDHQTQQFNDAETVKQALSAKITPSSPPAATDN